MNTSNATQLAQADRELWKGLLGAVVLFALLVVGVVMTSPNAAEARGWGHHDPEQMRERGAWGVEWILALVDADSAQQEQIQEILDTAIIDLMALHAEAKGGFHEQALAQLTAETVDPEAVEALRDEHMQKLEQASLRITEALVSASSVLTQEQRLELVERAELFRGCTHY